MRFIKENRLRFVNLYNHEDAVFTIEAFLSAKKLVLFNVSAFYAHFDDNYTMESSNQLTFTGNESFIDCGLEAYLYIRNLLNKPAYTDERKNTIKDYLSAFILRLYIKTDYRQENLLDFEKAAIANFSSVVYNYSNAFKKEIYIAPCFQSALGAARFIMSIGGVLGGILDNNPNSIVAARTKKYAAQWLAKDYQLNILRPQDIINFDKKLVLIFGFHSGSIAAQLASMGLIKGRHYIETGLF
jgi:hypothetical protein